jgi:hypothetical protein
LAVFVNFLEVVHFLHGSFRPIARSDEPAGQGTSQADDHERDQSIDEDENGVNTLNDVAHIMFIQLPNNFVVFIIPRPNQDDHEHSHQR